MKVEEQQLEKKNAPKSAFVILEHPEDNQVSSPDNAPSAVRPLSIEIPSFGTNARHPADSLRQQISPSLRWMSNRSSTSPNVLAKGVKHQAQAAPTTVAERFVQQQLRPRNTNIVPHKKPPHHRRLRKYASETSFSSAGSSGSVCREIPPLNDSTQSALEPLLPRCKEVKHGQAKMFLVKSVPHNNNNYLPVVPLSDETCQQASDISNIGISYSEGAKLPRKQADSDVEASASGGGSGSLGKGLFFRLANIILIRIFIIMECNIYQNRTFYLQN